jgi:2'-5' RNA ligase
VNGDRARLFIAIELDAAVRAALAATVVELARCGADARWSRPDNLHLTLKFLGNVAAEHIDRLAAALRSSVASTPAQAIPVRGLGVFPDARRPRVVWAGIDAPFLTALAASIDAACQALGFAAEARPFHPHVTLARLRSRRGWPALRARLDAAASRSFGSSDVKDVYLFRSDLRPAGAVYTKLCRAPLATRRDEGGSDGS